MARPIKNNADYFSHDADMRNDDRIKAVRKKFGLLGYAIYNMLLEYIADKDMWRVKYNALSLELMAGDFDEDPEVIKNIIDYFIKLSLFQLDGEFLKCKTLEVRLAGVLEKRARAKEQSKIQPRVNGRFSSKNTGEPDISVTETPQSKVKESKAFIAIGEKSDNYLIVKAQYITEKKKIIYDLEKFFELTNQLENLKYKGWVHFKPFMDLNPAKVFNDDNHVYNTFKIFSEGFLPPARAPDKFAKAEENKKLWTLVAWESHYKNQLETNIEFRKHFGYAELPPRTAMGIEN